MVNDQMVNGKWYMVNDQMVNIFDIVSLCTEDEVQRMLPLVNAQRREQALRYKHTFGRFCCLKSWLMLRELYSGEMQFRYNEHGKPEWDNGPFFSISHCKTGIAVAVHDQPVGIDIETIRPVSEDLVLRTMNENEQKLIRESEHPERVFTRLWTQKEAVVKCIGTGIESFEQLQNLLPSQLHVETFEKEKYIYSIAYGKLHCFGAQVPSANV